MKLAVSGKGGVGKTTFAALMIRTLNAEGKRVLAIDADPDANLAAGIGIADADKIIPIAEMEDLVFERTGAKPGSIGGYFKLNPKVDEAEWLNKPGSPKAKVNEKPQGETVDYDKLIQAWREGRVK